MATPTAPPAEEEVWEGHPSHATYLGSYLLCLLFCWLIVPIFIAFYLWVLVRSKQYRLTTQRLHYTEGIFNKSHDQLELYRVKDMQVEEPLKYRMFGRGTVILDTSDRSTPTFKLDAIEEPQQLANTLRNLVEQRRRERGVRELDIE